MADGKKIRICSVVSTEYRRVWQTETDGQTDRHLASRGKNTIGYTLIG